MAQVFISYRRDDGTYPSYLLCDYLLNKGYTVFYDKKSIRQGAFPDIIENAIKDCDEFVLIVTKLYFCERINNEEDWVRKEIEIALEHNKHIIPYFINAEMPAKDMLPQSIQSVTKFNGLKQLDVAYLEKKNEELINEFFHIAPIVKSLKDEIKNHTSIYDATFGDEEKRLLIQSNNSLSSDKFVLEDVFGGRENIEVLDAGCAYGYVGKSRFDDSKYSKVIGIDINTKCLEIAKTTEDNKFKYYHANIESDDFLDQMSNIMEENKIAKFDCIFLALVIHHLGDPKKALRKLRKLLKPNGVIIVRGSDDKSKLCSDTELLNQIIDKTLMQSGVSDRLNGRKIFTQLETTGLKNIKIYSFARDTSTLDWEEKTCLFNESFSYRINYFKKNLDREQTNKALCEFKEMEKLLAKFEDRFYDPDFWYCEYDYIGVGYLN